jgi:hypothetical protein
MNSFRRRAAALAAVVAICSSLVVAYDAAAEWDPNPLTGVVTAQDYHCGADDLPEGEIQGHIPAGDKTSGRAAKGYNCGLALVGHETLNNNGRPPGGNANMAWAGDCAYVSGSSNAVAPQTPPSPTPEAGVAVVDVSNPAKPRHVSTLRTPGAKATSETLGAVTTPEGRSLLVVGQYGNDQVTYAQTGDEAVTPRDPMDIYDVSAHDCSKPVFLGTYEWPDNIHNLSFSPDGRYVFATQPLQVIDIAGLLAGGGMESIKYLGNLDDAMEGPMFAVGPTADYDDQVPAEVREAQHPSYTSHEAWVVHDVASDGVTHTKLYLGGQLPTFELFTILDITAWLNGDGPPDVLSQRSGRAHSVRTATIGGKRYALHSEESPFGTGFSCIPETANPFAGPSQPWLSPVENDNGDDEMLPGVQMGLEINDPTHCQDQLQSNETDGVHYHDVDDQNDTTFAMASMWNAGIRVFDVRDPVQPKEVAYFNPGMIGSKLDHAWGHIRYRADKGHIWFATADGGFWVVRIEQQVLDHLGLGDKRNSTGSALSLTTSDRGWPGTKGATLPSSLADYVDVTPYYCTLGKVESLNTP